MRLLTRKITWSYQQWNNIKFILSSRGVVQRLLSCYGPSIVQYTQGHKSLWWEKVSRLIFIAKVLLDLQKPCHLILSQEMDNEKAFIMECFPMCYIVSMLIDFNISLIQLQNSCFWTWKKRPRLKVFSHNSNILYFKYCQCKNWENHMMFPWRKLPIYQPERLSPI